MKMKQIKKEMLVGTYKLRSGAMKSDDGKVDYPYGKAAIGYLFYLENGMMSFHMMASDRKPFPQYGLHGGSPQDNDAAFRTSLSFCGRYFIEGDEVWYDIETSSLPNMVGPRSHHSRAEIHDKRLHLISRPFSMDGHEWHTTFVWDKI